MVRPKSMVEVEVRGGALTVARWPGDGPALLMVHGISATHMSWPRVVSSPALAHCDIVAPDLRGRGASGTLPGPFGMVQHVTDLCAVLDALGLKRVCFVGHSMGAYIGVHFAVVAPERLTGLVLVDGGIALPRPEDGDVDRALEKALGPALARLSREFASRADYHAFWRPHPAFQDAGAWNADVEAYLDYDLGGTPPHLKSRVQEAAVREDGRGPSTPEMANLIDKVTVPTLLLTAPRGLLNQPEPLMPLASVRAKADALPHLEWRELADTNHYSITLGSGAEPVAAAIAEFAAARA